MVPLSFQAGTGTLLQAKEVKPYLFTLDVIVNEHQVEIKGYRCMQPGCNHQIKSYCPDLFTKHVRKHEIARQK